MKVQRGGIMIGKTTRLIMIDLNVKTLVKAKTKTHFKHNTITLISNHHPPSNYKDEETQQYIQQVISFLNKILPSLELT